MTWVRIFARTLALVAVVTLSLTSATKKPVSSPHEKAFYTNAATVEFVRPGLVFKITNAQIASDGTITATILVTDPQGLPLDRAGVSTPGAVSISMIAATIPAGQTQYVAYTTRTQTSPINGNTAIQAGSDAGGTFTLVSDGTYKYTFATKAPLGFEAGATHTIGAYGSRDLSLYKLGTGYASTTPPARVARLTEAVYTPSNTPFPLEQLEHIRLASRRGVPRSFCRARPKSSA